MKKQFYSSTDFRVNGKNGDFRINDNGSFVVKKGRMIKVIGSLLEFNAFYEEMGIEPPELDSENTEETIDENPKDFIYIKSLYGNEKVPIEKSNNEKLNKLLTAVAPYFNISGKKSFVDKLVREKDFGYEICIINPGSSRSGRWGQIVSIENNTDDRIRFVKNGSSYKIIHFQRQYYGRDNIEDTIGEIRL